MENTKAYSSPAICLLQIENEAGFCQSGVHESYYNNDLDYQWED